MGKLPSEAELSALIERYAGSRRVSCEQADLFFASLGELPVRVSAAEVAQGSWLDKLGPRSSAPPAQSAQAPALSMAAVHEVMPEEPITIEQALEHLPPTTYSSAPPPSALPSRDSAPVALPLSSRPAPQLTAADSVVVERWGMAETTPESEEDALLEQWSSGLDEVIGESGGADAGHEDVHAHAHEDVHAHADAHAHAHADAHADVHGDEDVDVDLREDVRGAAVATDAPERWSAPHLAGDAEAAQAAAVATDAPERWSAPHLAAETGGAQPLVSDDDAPLSAAELSLLEQWSATDSAAPAPPNGNGTSAQPAALTSDAEEEADLDVELEEIELEPDDLIEIDSE